MMFKDFLIPKQSKECHELIINYIEEIGDNFIRVFKDPKGNILIMRAIFPETNSIIKKNGRKSMVQKLNENESEIVQLIKEGMTGYQIANKYNVTASSFYVWKNKNKY